ADLRSWLRQLVRPAKARTEFDRAQAVASRGVPTVVPLALGEVSAAVGVRESFLLTHSLEGAESLYDFLEHRFPTLEPRQQTRLRQRLAVALGELLARMHDAGIAHGDLHAANVLLRLEADDRPVLFLIDLHAVRLGKPLDWPASRDNLVLINHWFILRGSRTDRCRFWRADCRPPNWPRAESRRPRTRPEQAPWGAHPPFCEQRGKPHLAG